MYALTQKHDNGKKFLEGTIKYITTEIILDTILEE